MKDNLNRFFIKCKFTQLMRSAIALLFVLLCGCSLASQNSSLQHKKGQKMINENATNIDDEVLDDEPIPFCYKTAWLAIPDASIKDIENNLGLQEVKKANWKKGFNFIDCNARSVFISPRIRGWTFVLMSMDCISSIEQLREFVIRTMKKIPNFYYFYTHRVSETHIWISVKNGKITRAFGYSGAEGQVLLDEGEISKEEISLGISLDQLKSGEWNDNIVFPDEENVHALSSAWTLDTLEIDKNNTGKSAGFIGHMK